VRGVVTSLSAKVGTKVKKESFQGRGSTKRPGRGTKNPRRTQKNVQPLKRGKIFSGGSTVPPVEGKKKTGKKITLTTSSIGGKRNLGRVVTFPR